MSLFPYFLSCDDFKIRKPLTVMPTTTQTSLAQPTKWVELMWYCGVKMSVSLFKSFHHLQLLVNFPEICSEGARLGWQHMYRVAT